jgi:hypothetical protein
MSLGRTKRHRTPQRGNGRSRRARVEPANPGTALPLHSLPRFLERQLREKTFKSAIDFRVKSLN